MKLFFSALLHDEINLDEAKGSQHVPLRDFMVQNNYLSDNFYKDLRYHLNTLIGGTSFWSGFRS